MRHAPHHDAGRHDHRELRSGAVASVVALALLAMVGPAPGRQAVSDVQVPAATEGPERELERARRAQRTFERIRRRHFVRAPASYDRCDELVGRFCLDHDGDESWTPSPEPSEVTERRGWLVATLDTVATVAGSDRWLLGQRVKYRVEAGRAAETLPELETCAAEDPWCRALLGFALHALRRHAAAELAFDRALADMPPEDRCAWTDVGLLLAPRDRRTYRRLACGSPARRAFERGIWHLSDPLWLVPGRERRVEHFARLVRSELETDAASGYGLPWGDDLTELTTRYGWPAGWDVAWRRFPGVRTERSIQAHRPPDAQRLVVSGFSRSGGDDLEWELDPDEPRSAWYPPFGAIHEPPHQIAVFRRGERRLVVAAFQAPDALGGCTARSGLFLANSFEEIGRAEGNGTLPLRVVEPRPSGSGTIVGLETLCTDGSAAGRVRARLARTDKRLSDLLLLEPVDVLPGTLDAALAVARRRSTARSGEALGVYWEWYGGDASIDGLSVTLSLMRQDKSFLRKALEWTGLAGRNDEEAGIRWTEPGRPGAVARAVELRLPELAPGSYRLTLQIESAQAGAVTSRREIVIEP
ncbi:MAG: hypothetical protein MJB57_14910 [Gemmatimonadetes bacterium]|nr:hypothetical protein [Gemmatimonadota bacterium]